MRHTIVRAIGGTTLALVLTAIAAGAAPRGGLDLATRPTVSFAQLRAGFRQPDMAYAPFAFWFWDAPLDPKRAANQAAEMLRQGFNPGYAHPRTGLPQEQWLSSRWFQSLSAAFDQVQARGGYMGYCDEYDWPSGRAGGRVLAAHPELRAVSLRWDVTPVAGGSTARLPASFFTVAGQTDAGGRLLSRTLRVIGAGVPFAWQAPAGAWRVYTFTKYHHAGIDGSPVNYLEPRLAQTMIDIAYTPYQRLMGSRLGGRMCGIFIDNEGDYGWKLAWSDHLASAYRTRCGRDIRLWMPLLVERDAEGTWARARWEWLDTVSDVYATGFFGRLSSWAADHGMYCTMHVWEESLLLQAEAVGDYFKVMRSVSLPGTDSLIRKPLEPDEFKETQSVSEFENRRQTSEVLGVVGWDMTPALLKQTTNAVTAWGVSHVMPHGVYLRPDLNTIPYPPDFLSENPYWPYFHQWTDYTRRASYVISHGHTVPDVLLLNPMDTMWANIGEWLLAPTPEGQRQAQHVNSVYFDALRRLTEARVEFLVGDRHYLRQMTAAGDGTLRRGDFRFHAVVLPPVDVLPLDVARKLVAFARAGGRVYALGDLPSGSTDHGMGDPVMQALVAELRAAPTFRQCTAGLAAELAHPGTTLTSRVTFLSGAFPMLQSHRRIDGRDFLWLANSGPESRQCLLRVQDVRGRAGLWDCETGTVRPVPSADTPTGAQVSLTFGPYEGFFLVFDPTQGPYVAPRVRPAAPARTVVVAGPWRVRIDPAAQPRLQPDTVPFCSVAWRAQWLPVRGTAVLRREFSLPGPVAAARVWVTADRSFALAVNGKAVPHRVGDDVWQQVTVLDLGPLLRSGRNVLAARVVAPQAAGGGFLLQGDATLKDGRHIAIGTGPGWQSGPAATGPSPMGDWIWHPVVRDNQTVYLRHAFDLPSGAVASSALARVSADNRFTLYVNGHLVGSGEPWMQPRTFDVARWLLPGRNAVAVKAGNDDGAAGLVLGMDVRLRGGREQTVRSDDGWRASLQVPAGWIGRDFDDHAWVPARVVGRYGDAPWGRFPDEALRLTPEWARGDHQALRAVEPLGPPSRCAWHDVPPALLAGEERPLASWLDWGLDRFSGYVDYTTTFTLGSAGRSVALDLGQIKQVVEVWLNGRKVGERMWPPFVFDVTAAARPGANTLRVRVGNLVVNEMAQFADRGLLGTWGWGPAPPRDAYDAGLLGPVRVTVTGPAGARPAGAQRSAPASRRASQ